MNLTENSKRVFYSLINHPEASNKELAQELNLHESTISKICKNFRKDGIINKSYLINVPGLEKGNLIYSSGKFRKKMDISKKHKIISSVLNPGKSFLRTFDDIYWGAMGYHKNGYDNNPNENKNLLDNIYDLDRYSFSCGDLNTYRYFDYYPIAKKTLDGENDSYQSRDDIDKIWSLNDLRDVEKNVIESLIKYPDDSDFRRSRRLEISNPTFTKIRRDLIDRQIIIPRYIPNMNAFNFGLISSFWVDLPKHVKQTQELEEICNLDNHIISLKSDESIFMISIFKNLRDLTEHLNRGSDLLTKLDIPYDKVNFHYVIYNSPNFKKELENIKLLDVLR